MATFTGAARHALGNLTRLSGRDTRSQFWFWVLWLFIVQQVLTIAMMIPMFVGLFGAINRFAAEHPDQATVVRSASGTSVSVQGYHPEIFAGFRFMVPLIALVAVVPVLLLFASVTRRLHDGDRSGWWAMPTLLFLVAGLAAMAAMMGSMFDQVTVGATAPPDPAIFRWFGWLMLGNLGYLVSLILLVVLLCLPGTTGPNRFGEDPMPLV